MKCYKLSKNENWHNRIFELAQLKFSYTKNGK